MKGKTRVIVAAFFVLVGSLAGPPSHAQTSTSGTILGSAVDPSGAVVAGAQVDLTNKATNWRTRVTTDGQGHYAFPNVVPGTYSVTIRTTGFRTLEENNVVVEVNTSSTINFKLIVGEANATTVEVTGQQIELQTTDATVGDVVSSEALLRLPTRLRSAQELLLLQPGTTPQYNGSDSGGSIAGAENDQTTFTMDGIDISDNSTNSTMDSEHGASPVIAISVESVSEFRVGTTNANSTFNRSSGGQVTLVGKSGTNALHGTLLWYLQNSALNANTWDNNRLGLAKPTVVDNRFGGNVGGPIIKDKTFFFFDYEGRRYPQKLQFQRIVPTATLKQGIIQFLDGAGNVVQYNLATADLCGPSGNAPCDPRGIGISPAMKTLFADDPTGNNSSLGDGLNTIGLQGNVRAPLSNDYTVFRIDHYFSQKWRFNGSFLYGRDLRNDTTVMDIRNPNDPVSLSKLPNWTSAIIGGITGQIRPDLINTFHVGFVRNRNGAPRQPLILHVERVIVGEEVAQERRVGHVPGAAAGHIERLAVAIDIAAERRQQRIGGGQVRGGNSGEVAPRQRRLAGTHAQGVSGNHPGAVVRFHADVLKVEAGLNVMPSMLPRRVVGQVISVGSPALRLGLVDRISEERAVHDTGHIALRVQEVRIGQVETAADFVGQGRGWRPAPGQRHQVGMGRVGGRRDGPIVVRNVRPVGVISIVRVGPAHRVARGDVVIHLAGQVVEQLVIALVEPVAAGVAAVADIRVVDLIARGHLCQDGQHARIHPGQAPQCEQVHLAGDAAGAISENPVARVGGKNGEILRHLLVCANAFVAGVEEQLVLADGAADIAAELILIQERPPDAGLVVEQIGR